MIECSFTNFAVVGSNLVSVTYQVIDKVSE